jgi:hypothetical protein
MSSETLRYNLLARVDWIQKLVSDTSTGSMRTQGMHFRASL